MNKKLGLFLLLFVRTQGMIKDRPFARSYLRIHKIKTGDRCYRYIPSVQESFAVSFSLVSCPIACDKRDLAKTLVNGLVIEINLVDGASARADKSKRLNKSKQAGIRALRELVQKLVIASEGEAAAVFWKAAFLELDDWILAEQ